MNYLIQKGSIRNVGSRTIQPIAGLLQHRVFSLAHACRHSPWNLIRHSSIPQLRTETAHFFPDAFLVAEQQSGSTRTVLVDDLRTNDIEDSRYG